MIEIIVTCLLTRAFLSKGESGKEFDQGPCFRFCRGVILGALLQVRNVVWDERAIDGEIVSATRDWR